MMTHNSSQTRIVAVWLVLLAFLCCMMVPSMALAKKEMTIGTEGDPEDGLDYSGGGSGIINGDTGESSSSVLESINEPIYFVFEFSSEINYFLIFPTFNQDFYKFNFNDEFKWRANK